MLCESAAHEVDADVDGAAADTCIPVLHGAQRDIVLPAGLRRRERGQQIPHGEMDDVPEAGQGFDAIRREIPVLSPDRGEGDVGEPCVAVGVVAHFVQCVVSLFCGHGVSSFLSGQPPGKPGIVVFGVDSKVGDRVALGDADGAAVGSGDAADGFDELGVFGAVDAGGVPALPVVPVLFVVGGDAFCTAECGAAAVAVGFVLAPDHVISDFLFHGDFLSGLWPVWWWVIFYLSPL